MCLVHDLQKPKKFYIKLYTSKWFKSSYKHVQ